METSMTFKQIINAIGVLTPCQSIVNIKYRGSQLVEEKGGVVEGIWDNYFVFEGWNDNSEIILEKYTVKIENIVYIEELDQWAIADLLRKPTSIEPVRPFFTPD